MDKLESFCLTQRQGTCFQTKRSWVRASPYAEHCHFTAVKWNSQNWNRSASWVSIWEIRLNECFDKHSFPVSSFWNHSDSCKNNCSVYHWAQPKYIYKRIRQVPENFFRFFRAFKLRVISVQYFIILPSVETVINQGLFTWSRGNSLSQGNSLGQLCLGARSDAWTVHMSLLLPWDKFELRLPVVQIRVARLAEVPCLHVNRT